MASPWCHRGVFEVTPRNGGRWEPSAYRVRHPGHAKSIADFRRRFLVVNPPPAPRPLPDGKDPAVIAECRRMLDEYRAMRAGVAVPSAASETPDEED